MEAYLPLWGFIILMVGTPGPANMMLMAAGASYGYRRLLPFLIGLILGKLAMNIAVAFGFAALLQDNPLILDWFAYMSAILMSVLLLRGWTPADISEGDRSVFGLLVGLVVHPLSPKTWMMTTIAFTQFSSGFTTIFETYFLIPLSFLFFQFISHSLWCFAGGLMKKRLSSNLMLHRGLILLTIAVIIWALFQ